MCNVFGISIGPGRGRTGTGHVIVLRPLAMAGTNGPTEFRDSARCPPKTGEWTRHSASAPSDRIDGASRPGGAFGAACSAPMLWGVIAGRAGDPWNRALGGEASVGGGRWSGARIAAAEVVPADARRSIRPCGSLTSEPGLGVLGEHRASRARYPVGARRILLVCSGGPCAGRSRTATYGGASRGPGVILRAAAAIRARLRDKMVV